MATKTKAAPKRVSKPVIHLKVDPAVYSVLSSMAKAEDRSIGAITRRLIGVGLNSKGNVARSR
jgi:hypothetical protein